MSARHAALLLAAMYCGLCTFGPTAMMTMPIFRLSRCREQLLNSLDVSAVRRKFIRLRQEDFLEESEESWEQRQLARRNFEAASELAYLFGENDKDLEASERTPEDLSLWAMHEQALVDAMEDGSIFGLPRVTGDLAWKRLRAQDEEELERLARQDSKQGRKRRGRRKLGHRKRH
ncbi:unnamed protein product [Effrenium voratum]|nr:unnamed protein product [Effrenium voratum]CAJ1452845.1 unnamed protein product [Effrenium voratum]